MSILSRAQGGQQNCFVFGVTFWVKEYNLKRHNIIYLCKGECSLITKNTGHAP